jgi:hypothetical protein
VFESRVQDLLRNWSGGKPKEKIELTLTQMESLILLDTPPFHLLGAKHLIDKKDMAADTVSVLAGRYAEIIRIAYGDTLADAVINSAADFASLMNQKRSSVLSSKDMIKLFQERVTNLCYHQLIDPVQLARLQQAVRDRSLASRVAEALAFRDKSPDFDDGFEGGRNSSREREILVPFCQLTLPLSLLILHICTPQPSTFNPQPSTLLPPRPPKKETDSFSFSLLKNCHIKALNC